MFIGKQVWDPWQICKQIILLQGAYYAGLYALELLLVAHFVQSPTPAILFTSSMVGYGTWSHLMLSFAFLINACAAAVALRFIVARAKKCWDFGATIYILHMLLTALYDGFPLNWLWWSIMVASMVATILLGEYFCVQFEMADIPISAGARGRRRDAQEQDLEAQIPLKIMSAADPK
eukprot:jgi/Ulvmu1/6012/UM026_0138.1